jgi:hypothetical protein
MGGSISTISTGGNGSKGCLAQFVAAMGTAFIRKANLRYFRASWLRDVLKRSEVKCEAFLGQE